MIVRTHRTLLSFALAASACNGTQTSAPDAAVDAPTDTTPDVSAPNGDPASWDVRRRGPFRVGHRVVMHTYTPRGQSTPRTIPVHVWYPTLALDGAHPTYARLIRDDAAISDAPPAAPAHAGGYPVHVYSHGDRGFAATSHFLSRFFASHGWITVSPDHVGNTIFDMPPGGTPFRILHLRSQDVRAALDVLHTPLLSLAGRADTERVVLSGHSFGVHTVWSSLGATFDPAGVMMRCTPASACTPDDVAVLREGLGDPRIVGAIAMAGAINRGLFGPDGHRSVRAPVLALSGTDDPVGADLQFMSTVPVDVTWVDVRGGCHQFFALGGCDNIPDAEQDTILGTWSLAFARRYVLNDQTQTVRDVLTGTLPLSDRITLRRR